MASKQRSFAFDFIRFVAICMVVGIHSLPPDSSTIAVRWYGSIMRAFLFLTNVLFFCLSGRLNIRVIDDKQLPSYYYKKFTRVLFPVLIFVFFQTVYERFSEGPRVVFRSYVLNVLGDYSGGIHWFVMSLFGMLLAAPILAPVVSQMTPARKRAFFAWFTLFTIPGLILCRSGHSFGWKNPLGGFFGCFLLGAMLDLKRFETVSPWRIALPTLACIGISATLLFLGFPHHPINDETPMYYLAGIGLFILLHKWGQRMAPIPWMSAIARHSFGIYLCHMPLVGIISPLFSSMAIPSQHLLTVVFAVMASFICSSAIDSLIVHPSQKLFDRLWETHGNKLV